MRWFGMRFKNGVTFSSQLWREEVSLGIEVEINSKMYLRNTSLKGGSMFCINNSKKNLIKEESCLEANLWMQERTCTTCPHLKT